jgi:hypothetical protein
MLFVGPDIPALLQPILKAVVDAIADIRAPGKPTQLAAVTFAQLPPAANWRNCMVIVTDRNTIAVSTPSGSTWAWTRSDGSAL